jgi:hypothetical protein
MSNTLGGINLQVIAQDSLTTLLAQFPLVNKFTTDFGGDILQRGESVTTRLASGVAATNIGVDGYVKSDVASVAKTVTLNKHKGFVMGFQDGEVARGGYDVLRRTFIRPAAHAVVKAVMDDVFLLCTAGNFSSVGYNGTVAAFDADAVADISQALTDANVPMANRTLIVRPALYTSLAKDNAIQAQYASGTNAPLTENLLPRIHGFEVNQYSALPNGSMGVINDGLSNEVDFTVLDNNLKGIAVSPEAILIAARLPATPTNWYGNVATATDAESGLSIQVREWYDGDSGQQKLSMSILYGMTVGNAANLSRIIASA